MAPEAAPEPSPARPVGYLPIDAPHTPGGILRRLGPGLIIAGSIVGSGELIGTTKVGAEAGFALLWLILLGCLIKVFVQVEFGRFAIAEGRSTLDGLNAVPGPRWGVNWMVWYWIVMFVFMLGQLGGIVGGVGQTMALSLPITGDFLREVERGAALQRPPAAQPASPAPAAQSPPARPPAPRTWDDVTWSAALTVVTAVLLVNGRYGLIQTVSTVLVAGFTFVTLLSLFGLQVHPRWAITWENLRQGLSFGLPPPSEGRFPLNTALSTFGIIGVGAAELVAYPYWCLEKGYARFVGPRDESAGWGPRARGWLRVMRWDAWCSLLVYTVATVAFYLLGAAVLHREGLNPSGTQMVRTLEAMYAGNDFFLGWGRGVFFVGAFAVLYSTFFVATAGNARVAADAVRQFGLGAADEKRLRWWIRAFCGLFPFLSLAIYAGHKDPVRLVLWSGLVQAIFLPLLGGAALFFRYRRCDARVTPGRLWDALLWLSVAGLCVTGSYGAWTELSKLLAW